MYDTDTIIYSSFKSFKIIGNFRIVFLINLQIKNNY